MHRARRHAEILRILRRGGAHRAEDMARELGVSVRTIYRDIARLGAAGVPVAGTPGTGYRLPDLVPLPPVTLTPDELEALQLGIAIVGEADDPGLRAAAERLADKIDAALPTETVAEADAWKFAAMPGADAARGFALTGTLRSAIRGRQKLRLILSGDTRPRKVRPLRLQHMGRIWLLTVWCETRGKFDELRTDLIETAAPLPELFVDEPGKTLADFDAPGG